jgi:RNA-binding protein Musashi
MRVFFSKFGKVVDATVMVDRETGRSKGFGFVTFEDNSNDSQLVGKLGLILDDKQVRPRPLWCSCRSAILILSSAAQIEVKTAQPRSQRDQQRSNAGSQNSSFNNGQVAAANTAAMGTSMPFMTMNNAGAGDMSMMYQRMMNGMNTPYGAMMGGGGMGMMGAFNPMVGMGMGMGRFGMGAMGGMGGSGAVSGMTPMAAGSSMGGNMGMGGAVGGMRLGMGPIGMTGGGTGMAAMVPAGMGTAAAAAAMGGGGMAMGMRQNMGMMGAGRGRPGMNQGPGPARITNRGQHGFHPYARWFSFPVSRFPLFLDVLPCLRRLRCYHLLVSGYATLLSPFFFSF